ncbi:MAG: hypothetical protein ACRD11_00600 [Terriglobia bacterium]
MKTRLACFVVLAGCVVALRASATSLVRLSLDQLTQASIAVVQGHVVGQVTQWNATHTEIVTLTTIAVDQNVKGNTPAQIVVEQMGGTVGHMHLIVPGTERFYPQARYELFLQHGAANPAHFLLVGMREGAYRIYQDQQTHQERVINPMGNIFYRQGTGSGTGASSTTLPATVPLTEFQQKVSSAAASPIVIPHGTAIPVTIRSVSFDGAGRVQLEAETTAELYPNQHVVVPVGSLVDGWGQELGGRWTLHWTAVSIRGSQARISAINHAAGISELQGEHLILMTK